ncbi:MAG: peptidoglycan-binding protein [Clostridia bacterium]|nr:peptidoglycan-binding protein [Clostridia bacterium]
MITEHSNRLTVENLQRYLRQLALFEKNIPVVAIDGIYDQQTRDAVIAFQHSIGLEETGTVDYSTWTLLFEAYIASVLQHEEPAGFSPFPRFPTGYSIGSGNRQFLVEIIQYILNELSTEIVDIPRNAQGGMYDEDTEQGIRSFQRTHLLKETGRVDKTTWNALVAAYNQMQRQSS